MPEYRRIFIPGDMYFFTVVTYNRTPFLTTPLARSILRHAWKSVQTRHPFEMIAMCLLPDHLHCLWMLPENDPNYSIRWRAIKGLFSREFTARGGFQGEINHSRSKRREKAVWQRRFWEHTIRNEEDYNRHFDYIHFNPAKHGFVKTVNDWPWSTFHKYRRLGHYPPDWGANDLKEQNIDFGE